MWGGVTRFGVFVFPPPPLHQLSVLNLFAYCLPKMVITHVHSTLTNAPSQTNASVAPLGRKAKPLVVMAISAAPLLEWRGVRIPTPTAWHGACRPARR